jgi:hypothetical protein
MGITPQYLHMDRLGRVKRTHILFFFIRCDNWRMLPYAKASLLLSQTLNSFPASLSLEVRRDMPIAASFLDPYQLSLQNFKGRKTWHIPAAFPILKYTTIMDMIYFRMSIHNLLN